MSDDIQANPSMPLPESGPQLRDRFGTVNIRKRKRIYLPLAILAVAALGVLAAMLVGHFYNQRARSAAIRSSPSEIFSKNIPNGTWHATAMLYDGKLVSVAKGLNITLVLEGNKFTLTLPQRELSGSWVCRNSTEPFEIDFFDATGSTIEAIYDYEVTDGVLRICFGEDGGKPIRHFTDGLTARPDATFTAISFKRQLAGKQR